MQQDSTCNQFAFPSAVMTSQAGCRPEMLPVLDASVNDPLLKLQQDIALAQMNQMQFGHYFGNYGPDAFASGVTSGGGGFASQSTQNSNAITELSDTVRRLQDSHIRMTKRIYGVQAARTQAKCMGRGSGEVRMSSGELVVATVRTVSHNNVCIELLISRNDKTSIASLETYFLGQPQLQWMRQVIEPSGTPLETLRAYVAQKDSIVQDGITVNSVVIDASLLNGFRQSARCFCNEAFSIDFEAHGPVQCALHQVATSVVVRIRENVAPHAMVGQPLILKDVPPIHHSIFKTSADIACASLNQWPLCPPTVPKKKSKRARAKKNEQSNDVMVQKQPQKLQRT